MSVEKDDEVKPKVIRKRVTKEKVGFLPNEIGRASCRERV